METSILILLYLLGIYWLAGWCFGLVFLVKGLEKTDSSATGTTWFFKILILPGLSVFWPLFLSRWIRSKKEQS